MSKPVPGFVYIVVLGDTLESIAAQAYGNPKLWTLLANANFLSRRSDNTVAVTVGQIINIPILAASTRESEVIGRTLSAPARLRSAPQQLINKGPEDLTILIDGLELVIEEAHIIKSIESGAFGWTATIKFDPGADIELDERLLPFKYPPADVYIGNELIVSGLVYTVETILAKDGRRKVLEGWSFTADIVDSNLKPPYESSNITLRQRAEELVRPLGLNVIYDVDTDEFFDRVTAKPNEKIFTHLAKLASQRGILITTSANGDVRFVRAATSPVVGTLTEGDPLVPEWGARYDGRKRFNAYTAIGQSPGNSSKTATAIDSTVPRSRFMTFRANDTTDGNIQTAADWKRSKQLAQILSNPYPVSSWIAPDGNVWLENTLVTVVAPSLHLADGFTFLIKTIEFIYSIQGQTAVLHLVPPQAYTGEAIPEAWS